jgi:hypothetical protein
MILSRPERWFVVQLGEQAVQTRTLDEAIVADLKKARHGS